MHPRSNPHPGTQPDDGFMLLGLIVAIAIMLLILGLAAPRVAKDLRRDREVETVHRGNQYIRAIQLYYKKLGHYPGTIEQLEGTNKIRFLRQRYVDPITGKDDWRTIPVGQNQTTVKGFFGEPLSGLASTGLGSLSSSVSTGFGTAAGSTPVGPGAPGAPGTAAAPGAPSPPGTVAPGAPGATSTFGSSSPLGSQSASVFSGSSAPFMGVGLSATGASIVELNEQTTYDTWEFLYDPRIELLKAKAGLNGVNAGSVSAGALGQNPGSVGTPGSAPTGPTTPTTPPQ